MSRSDEAYEKQDRRRAATAQKKTGKYNQRATGAAADWETVAAELVHRTIATVSAAGGAVRMGYTSDDGAYALGVYSKGECENVYVEPTGNIEGVLNAIIEDFAK